VKKQLITILGAAGASAILAGCGSNEPSPAPVAVSTPPVDTSWVPKGIDAGLELPNQTPLDPATRKMLVASRPFTMRSNPFALHPEEQAFERRQLGERLVQSEGFFGLRYTPPPEVDNRPVFEEQPYRRLAGVIVGESVLAIIEMGDGQAPLIIRPGQRIPNSEWTVVSIDEDKAVLRRSGNKLPKEIVVRLESKPFDGGGNQGGPAGGGGPVGGGTPGGRGTGREGPGSGPGGGPVGG
jgi:hypothetical protein